MNDPEVPPLASIIKEVGRGAKAPHDLDAAMAERLYGAMLDGRVPELELGALLLAYRIKGEAPEELIGFHRATQARIHRIRSPAGKPLLVLPSYNGARKQPNLLPLAALTAASCGLAVLVHGVIDDFGRTTSAAILHRLGVEPARSVDEAERALQRGGLAFVPIETLAPGLATLLATRRRLGVRTSAHTVVKLIDPAEGGPSLRIVAVTHPDYLERMRSFLTATKATALLLRGTEGEPVVPASRLVRIERFDQGRDELMQDAMATASPSLPESIDASVTASWTTRVLARELPLPESIEHWIACCLVAAGVADSIDAGRQEIRKCDFFPIRATS